jgi:predicted nucleotidyltransferase
MAFFGSVLGEEFGPESDVDILVTFTPDADWGLFDQLRMEQQLSELLNRKVDLFTREAVEQNHNWIRRREILGAAEVVYAS